MATLTIRGIDEGLKARLRVRAAEKGRSMEAEVRAILEEALDERRGEVPSTGLGTWIHERFAAIGGWDDFEPPDRSDMPRAAEFPE